MNFRPGEGIHPFCAETWFPFIDKNNVWIPFCLYIYAAVMDAILMAQWNAMVMVLMLYVISMIKILRYKFHNNAYITSELKQKARSGNITSKERYSFIVDRVKEHLFIIE